MIPEFQMLVVSSLSELGRKERGKPSTYPSSVSFWQLFLKSWGFVTIYGQMDLKFCNPD